MQHTENGNRAQIASSDGFSLIEVLIASSILLVGVLGVAVMLAKSIESSFVSRNVSEITELAHIKLEDLKNREANTDPQLQVGGSLGSNQANHFDVVTGYTRRWTVADAPGNLISVTMRVIPNAQDHSNKVVTMTTLIRDR